MVAVVDNKLAGYIAAADPLKDDSKTTVKQLQEQGLKVVSVEYA